MAVVTSDSQPRECPEATNAECLVADTRHFGKRWMRQAKNLKETGDLEVALWVEVALGHTQRGPVEGLSMAVSLWGWPGAKLLRPSPH